MTADQHPRTPDGRYFVVNGRLWRLSNPGLPPAERERLVGELMAARRMIGTAKGDRETVRSARGRVDAAKVALGERGPAWWDDGAPDFNLKMARNTPYADWFARLPAVGGSGASGGLDSIRGLSAGWSTAAATVDQMDSGSSNLPANPRPVSDESCCKS